jgi:signal transduction histidine kinase
MTHELKSPLASIQLYLETLNEKRIPGKKRKEFLGLMMQDTSRLNNLIVSILEIAGLEQKRIAHHFEVAAAEPLIRGLVREAIEQFKLPRNAIRIAGSAACRIVTDRNALKIVFNNLIDNAVKYSTGSARIDVRLGFSPKILWVEFRDQGIGISVTDQKRIFDKFLRLYDPHVPSVKGTGLGLYWVKEIMRLHHGRVSVTSDGENKGSTFRIELPVYRTGEKGRLQDLLKTIRNGQQRPDTERGGNHAPAH